MDGLHQFRNRCTPEMLAAVLDTCSSPLCLLARASHRHQLGDWPAMPCDGQTFAVRNSVEQPGQMFFGFMRVDTIYECFFTSIEAISDK